MEPLTLAQVALLVSMIETGGRSGNWWAMKSRTIIALATYLDGEWWNGPDVEQLTGIPASHARRLLKELADQRVIVRSGGSGDASKVFWCQVNPDWRAWRVEWAMAPRQIEAALAVAERRWSRSPLDRLLSRPAGARSHAAIAQVTARDLDRVLAHQGARIAREGSAIPRSGSRVDRARSRATRREEVALLATAGAETDSSLSTAQEEEGRQHPKWGSVVGAYKRKAGAAYLNGAPERHLARLVAEHGADEVLQAITATADGPRHKQLAIEVERHLLAPPDDEVATVTSIDRAAATANLERLAATYIDQGAAVPESLLEQLAQWHDGNKLLEEA